MKEKLQAFRDMLLEKVPHKNYSPAEKAARTKRAVITGCVVGVLLLVFLVVALFPRRKSNNVCLRANCL